MLTARFLKGPFLIRTKMTILLHAVAVKPVDNKIIKILENVYRSILKQKILKAWAEITMAGWEDYPHPSYFVKFNPFFVVVSAIFPVWILQVHPGPPILA